MGLRQSTPSESEDNDVEDETNTLEETLTQSNSNKQNGKNDGISTKYRELLEHIEELQLDDHSERIIREKEKLLKEKEVTIRQQAQLIKTQSDLLGQRKHRRNMPNVGSVNAICDVGCKPRTKLTKSAKVFTSLENVHANGQDDRNDNDFEKKYIFDRRTIQRQEQLTNIHKTTNLPTTSFTYGNSFHRDPRSSASANQHYYASNQDYNVSSSNSNGLDSKPIARRSKNNEYRRANSKSDEFKDYDGKQLTNELLSDLEKQTHYEIRKLDNVQNGDRPLKQLNHVKCTGSRVVRRSRTVPAGLLQKCKKCCGMDGDSNGMRRTVTDDDESRNQSMWMSDSEFIYDVD